MTESLPEGVVVRPLTVHADARGSLTEIYRREWGDCDAVQFNWVNNRANVLRGVHVHVRHADHLVMVSGDMELGLHDLRPWSADFRRSCVLRLEAAEPIAVTIPPGVAHGFYFAKPAILVYATSTYWDAADELGCHWDAPELGLRWQAQDPVLSARDRAAGRYAQMAERFVADWNALHGSHVTA
jgi:dTDP-4-dehydrorhamnose 3,5-epimerase